MSRCLVFVVAAVAGAPLPASADVGELEAALTSSVGLLQRHGRVNTGAGAGIRASYGLSDWLAVGGSFDCDRFASLAQSNYSHAGVSGRLFYDTTRCTFVPSGIFRLGAKYAVTVAAGVGYRFDNQSNRELVSADKILLARIDASSRHQLVGALRAAFEYRVFDWLSASAFVRAVGVLTGGKSELDAAGGVAASLYLYP